MLPYCFSQASTSNTLIILQTYIYYVIILRIVILAVLNQLKKHCEIALKVNDRYIVIQDHAVCSRPHDEGY